MTLKAGGRLIILVATAITVAGCGNGSSVETNAQSESINDFIPGFENFDPEAGPEDFAAQEQQVQELTQSCMAEQGFEYIPYVPNQDQFFSGENPEDYVNEYGFGIATQMLLDSGFEEGVPPEVEDDPNFAIQEAMSPAEQEAYFAALYGAQPDIDTSSMTEDEIDEFFQGFDPGGCQNDAYDQVYNFDEGASMAFYEEFGQDLEAIYERVQADPRMLEQEQKWADCMKEAGHDFTKQNEPEIYIMRRLEEVGAIQDLEVDPEGGIGYSSEGIQEGTEMFKAVEAIAEEEIALAKKSLECGAQDQDLSQEIYQEYEQLWIEENRVALEEFRDKATTDSTEAPASP